MVVGDFLEFVVLELETVQGLAEVEVELLVVDFYELVG